PYHHLGWCSRVAWAPTDRCIDNLVAKGALVMTSAMMMERPGMMMPGMSQGMPASGTAPMMPNMMMVPRCKMKFEKMSGGMKISCACDDPTACSMMRNLCNMLAGGMVSCCAMMNGMTVCCCNM